MTSLTPLIFAGLYVFIGALIGATVLVVRGRPLVEQLHMLARADGLEMTAAQIIVTVLAIFCMFWPVLVAERGL